MTAEAPTAPPPANSVGWYILEGFPWWPVYVCDQTKLRENLHLLGDGHRGILRKAREFPTDFALVYYFGSHEFSSVRLDLPVLKPWDCPEKALMLKGHPKHLAKRGSNKDDLMFAIDEAEEFLAQPEDIRLPPCMVPSDLDPTLEPPPPEEDLDMEEQLVDDKGDDEEEFADEPVDIDEEDDEDKQAKPKEDKKKKKEKKAKKEKKEKKERKEKKEKKDKEEKKEKKDNKEKKDKSSSSKKSKKDDKASSKSDSKSTESKETKISKKLSTSDKSPTKKRACSNDDSSPHKKAKTSGSSPATMTNATPYASTSSPVKESLVKSEPTAASPKSTEVKKPSGPSVDEDLSAVLEKEIRWILVNCQFEQMTTKQVRKLLEKRLNRDLRKHKAEIKAGVERVIASMEDEEMADATEPASSKNTATEPPVEPKPEPIPEVELKAPKEESSSNEPPTIPDVKEEVKPDVKSERTEDQKAEATTEDTTLQQFQQYATQLSQAAGDDPRILEIMKAMKEISTVDKDEVVQSGLVTSLEEVGRTNSSASILQELSSIASSWKLEDLIPAPKPIKVEDILSMKDKLVNPQASHEELLSCLHELEQMPLEIVHLKKTGIARAVASLRQHANDNVSITAKNLRNSWIRLLGKEGPDGKRMKKLENMIHVLEKKADAEHQAQLVQTQLRVLTKLEAMSLTIQEIIDSKIGVIVSKLRKASDKDIAQAAGRLRRKWKQEAAAGASQ